MSTVICQGEHVSESDGKHTDQMPSRLGPTSAEELDERLNLVLSESLRALAHQQATLDSLRSRTTVLTAAAALVSSLLGGRVLDAADVGPPAAVALIGLSSVLTCALIISAPWWRWRFRSSAKALIDACDAGHDLNSIRRHLAIDFESWLDQNERKLRALQWWFGVGIVSMFVEVIGWMLPILDGGSRA